MSIIFCIYVILFPSYSCIVSLVSFLSVLSNLILDQCHHINNVSAASSAPKRFILSNPHIFLAEVFTLNTFIWTRTHTWTHTKKIFVSCHSMATSVGTEPSAWAMSLTLATESACVEFRKLDLDLVYSILENERNLKDQFIVHVLLHVLQCLYTCRFLLCFPSWKQFLNPN